LCYCYIANIEDIGIFDDNGWVRSSDSYCNVSRYNLTQKLNGIYERGIKQVLTFRKEGNHFVLCNGGNKVSSP